MRYLLTVLCILSLHVGTFSGLVKAEDEVKTDVGIEITLDDSEIQEEYDHLPELVIRVKEEAFHESMQAYVYDSQKEELVNVEAEWQKEEHAQKESEGNEQSQAEGLIKEVRSKKGDREVIKGKAEVDEKEDIEYVYVLRWKFSQPIENTYIVVKAEDILYAQSEAFSIRCPVQEPLFYVDEQLLKADHTYASEKNMQVRVQFFEQMQQDKTWISWQGSKLALTWNEQDNSAEFMLAEEGEGTLQYALKSIRGSELKKATPFTVLMDQSAPEVQIFINDVEQQAMQQRYEQVVPIKVVVKDRSFDMENSFFAINEEVQIVKWKKEKDSYTCEMVVGDGNYLLSYSMQDKLQHVTSASLTPFQVDTIAPTITLKKEFATNFTKQQVHILVQDASLDETQTSLYVMRNKELNIEHPEWIQEGDYLSCDRTWTKEGEYEVFVVSTDVLKHTTTSSPIKFTIDNTPPTASVKLNQKHQQPDRAYLTNRNVRVDASVEDSYLSQKEMSLYKNGELQFQKQEWEAFEVMAEQAKNNDYELVLYGKDEAGNENRLHYLFAIHTDRKDPQIANDIFHGKPSNQSWRPRLLYASEYKTIQATLRKTHIIQDYHWGDKIVEEGVYTLEVMVEDKAGNRRWLQPSFPFVIDKTPPVVQLIHENMQQMLYARVQVHDTFLLMIEPYDMYLQKQGQFTYIRVNGERIDLSDEKRVPLRFDRAGKYLIEVGVIDEAGNTADYRWNLEAIEERVEYPHVDRPVVVEDKQVLPVKASNSIPLYVLLSAPCLIAGLGCFYYVRKRKN